MFARALVVLLLMLNLGVALWWLARPAPVGDAVAPASEGAVRLQLLAEAPARATAAATSGRQAAGSEVAGGARLAAAGAVASTKLRCFSLGPFPDAAIASSARTRLALPEVVRARARETTTGGRAWNVSLPPLADRAAAEAMATRLREAGFQDLFVVPAGESANSLALGRYGTESAARQRAAALQAAGFAAQAQPIGDAATRHWIDVTAAPGFDAAQAQRVTGATQVQPIDCPDPG